ncbi:hypothetical protein FB451DRAFT_1418013 [Mycena latifolia]|nr:hypothetical protein FB451DRAFT_1418013 [Mycena latifolia]
MRRCPREAPAEGELSVRRGEWLLFGERGLRAEVLLGKPALAARERQAYGAEDSARAVLYRRAPARLRCASPSDFHRHPTAPSLSALRLISILVPALNSSTSAPFADLAGRWRLPPPRADCAPSSGAAEHKAIESARRRSGVGLAHMHLCRIGTQVRTSRERAELTFPLWAGPPAELTSTWFATKMTNTAARIRRAKKVDEPSRKS